MPRLPQKIPSNQPFSVQWNAMVDYLASIRPLESAGTRTEHTVFGVLRHAAPQKGSSRSGMSHLGEWSAATSYKAQQIVTRGALGEFIAFQDPPTGTAPETGAPYWHAWVHPFPGVWG